MISLNDDLVVLVKSVLYTHVL